MASISVLAIRESILRLSISKSARLRSSSTRKRLRIDEEGDEAEACCLLIVGDTSDAAAGGWTTAVVLAVVAMEGDVAANLGEVADDA